MTNMGIRLFDNKASFDLLISHTPFTRLSQPPIVITPTKIQINKNKQIPKQQDKYKMEATAIFLICLNLSLILIFAIYKKYKNFWKGVYIIYTTPIP